MRGFCTIRFGQLFTVLSAKIRESFEHSLVRCAMLGPGVQVIARLYYVNIRVRAVRTPGTQIPAPLRLEATVA
jgi:hypothetical protein